MNQPIIKTNRENPGTSVVQVKMPTLQFLFRCGLDEGKPLNDSNLNSLKYLIWNVSTGQPIKAGSATRVQKLTHNPANIDQTEMDKKFWVCTAEVRVPLGAQVGIYLNTEVDFKQTLLYEFEVKGNATVVILEGQDNLVPHYTKITDEMLDYKTQIIRGYLTAEAWFKITHRYTPAEARTLLDKTSYPEHIKAAIVTIYEGKTKAATHDDPQRHFLSIPYPQGGKLGFNDPEGGGKSNYKFFKNAGLNVDSVEVVTRTSPIAYAAVIHAAMKNNFMEIRLNSLWRCMFGSVLHREGRAIDIGSIDNRDVRKKDTEYLAQQKEWKEHKTKEKSEGKKLDDTLTEFGQIKALGTIRLKESQGKPLTDEEKSNKDKWNQVEDKLLGFSGIRLLRLQLQADPNVENMFDPWLLDNSVGDSNAGETNRFSSGLEKVHRHHLHVTVRKIR